MHPDLPPTLERYFAAQNRHDLEALVACFAPDAVVRDEGATIMGTDAIRTWKQATTAKYQVQASPLRSQAEAGHVLVVARVAGNFPGSPAELTYRFDLAPDGRIGALAIG
jgi:ketosteroid isomerase-like protein